DQWDFAGPIVAWLGIAAAFTAVFSTLSGHILVVLGHERSMFFINWIKLAVFGTIVLLAAQTGDVVKIAMAAAFSMGGITVGFAFYLPRILPVSTMQILRQILPALAISAAMFLVVR